MQVESAPPSHLDGELPVGAARVGEEVVLLFRRGAFRRQLHCWDLWPPGPWRVLSQDTAVVGGAQCDVRPAHDIVEADGGLDLARQEVRIAAGGLEVLVQLVFAFGRVDAVGVLLEVQMRPPLLMFVVALAANEADGRLFCVAAAAALRSVEPSLTRKRRSACEALANLAIMTGRPLALAAAAGRRWRNC